MIIGPLITSVGIYLLSGIGITEGPQEYWSTYFPYFLVFAFGMSMTVVPLTTAVMTSVSENQSGIASGINNSVTRIAGTFMNAVLGAVAIYLFAGYVADGLESFTLTETQREEIMLETERLGEARAPESLTPTLKASAEKVYDFSFINVYRWVGVLSAILALTSALLALAFVRDEDCQQKNQT